MQLCLLIGVIGLSLRNQDQNNLLFYRAPATRAYDTPSPGHQPLCPHPAHALFLTLLPPGPFLHAPGA